MSDSGCDYENFCLELIDGSLAGVIVEIFLAIYAFVGIAAVATASAIGAGRPHAQAMEACGRRGQA